MRGSALVLVCAALACSAAQEEHAIERAPTAARDAGFSNTDNSSNGVSPSARAVRPRPRAAALHGASAAETGAGVSAAPLGPGERAAALDELLAQLPAASRSTSVGSPTNGRLRGGVALPLMGPGYRFNDRRSRDARFATVEVVRAIMRAAAAVANDLPGGELIVNDLGLEGGGPIAHHGSHRAGRDADLLFYLLDAAGRPISSVGAPLDPSGEGDDYKDLSTPDDDVHVRLDVPRTWRFIRALLEDPEAEVQRIFVVEHLRARLLAEAERSRAPQQVVARFAEVTCQPSYPHDDHLHVRWYCSSEDLREGCEDAPPLYPWREQTLRAQGVKPVVARRVRSEDPAPVVTLADAQRAVEERAPHPSVLAFLERRKAWERQPHPRRPYCP